MGTDGEWILQVDLLRDSTLSNGTLSNGTLIWIGDERAECFAPAYDYCVRHAPQIARRASPQEAVSRAASDVRWILHARTNRVGTGIEPIFERYPTAKSLTLLGPLCRGIRLGDHRFNCHDSERWTHVLPRMLGVGSKASSQPSRSVAVVAGTRVAAEPLIEVAASTGAATVWCRTITNRQVRNIDAVWWDDSVATPGRSTTWRSRIERFGYPGRSVQHTWVTNPQPVDHWKSAEAGGVSLIVYKPYLVDQLVNSLTKHSVGVSDQCSIAPAA